MGRPAASPSATAQRDPLRSGKLVEPSEQRRAQLMQPGVGQLHLRLDARDAARPGNRARGPPPSAGTPSCRCPPRRGRRAPRSPPAGRGPIAARVAHVHRSAVELGHEAASLNAMSVPEPAQRPGNHTHEGRSGTGNLLLPGWIEPGAAGSMDAMNLGICIVALVGLTTCLSAAPAGAVVGGERVAPETVRGSRRSRAVAETLVTPDRLLTAAHCVGGSQPVAGRPDGRRRAGAHDHPPFALHPGHRAKNGENFLDDVAIVALDQPVVGVTPVTLGEATGPARIVGMGFGLAPGTGHREADPHQRRAAAGDAAPAL